MALEKEENSMISMKIMKSIGIYQMTSPKTQRVFGDNITKLFFIIQLVIMCIYFLMIVINMHYFTNDLIYVVNYLNFFVADLLIVLKMYNLMKNYDRISNFIKTTSIDYFSYKYHSRDILKNGKKQSKYYANLNMCVWISATLIWIISPIFTNKLSDDIIQSNEVYYYRSNILQFVYPATGKFYNVYFIMYYIFECIIFVIWVHSDIIFDYLMITICIVIMFQLNTIVHSYSSFSTTHKHIIGKA